jgi:hypothetical protein
MMVVSRDCSGLKSTEQILANSDYTFFDWNADFFAEREKNYFFDVKFLTQLIFG